MRHIKFRPLRRDKKSGKIMVANYMQWRKIQTSNYDPFILEISKDHEAFDPNERVYNHKGEPLFFANWFDPCTDFDPSITYMKNIFKRYGLWIHLPFIDIDGIPLFSHFDAKHTANATSTINIIAFDPLTVGTVTKWLMWMVLEMKNAKVIQ